MGCIAPVSSISRSEACTSNNGGGIHLKCSLKGSMLVIQISCSTALVQPSSLPSNAKTSWKVRTSFRAAAAFHGVQLLGPSRFSFSKSFSCHSATDKGGCLSSAPRTTSISRESFTGGTSDVETTLEICTPFFRKIGDSDMFLTITNTFAAAHLEPAVCM